jgi:hypothetical protein
MQIRQNLEIDVFAIRVPSLTGSLHEKLKAKNKELRKVCTAFLHGYDSVMHSKL